MIFIRVIEADDKAAALKAAISNNPNGDRYVKSLTDFEAIPGSPFAYWASKAAIRAFSTWPAFSQSYGRAWVGLQTNDDNRWLRLWWECPQGSQEYVPFAKGGSFARYYSDLHLCVRWGTDGYNIKNWKIDELRRGRITANNSRCWNEMHYFRRGLTWPRRTSGLSFRLLPDLCIFGDKGPAAFSEGDCPRSLLAMCAILNSKAFGALVNLQLARTELAQSYEVGLIQQTPIPPIDRETEEKLADLAGKAWATQRSMDKTVETSRAFLLPAKLIHRVSGVTGGDAKSTLESIQSEIDDAVFRVYGLSSRECTLPKETIDPDGLVKDDAAEDREQIKEEDALLSWCVGVAFGRFDRSLALGERALPMDPAPFDPLPDLSPGMLPKTDPAHHSLIDILVDDLGHKRDLPRLILETLEMLNLHPDSAYALSDVRTWLSQAFWVSHLRAYSKSRRKAPIYWQFAVASGLYSVWTYTQAFTRDTLHRMTNEFVAPKLLQERRHLEGLRTEAGPSKTSTKVKAIEAQEKLVDELTSFQEEIMRVAPLWDPNPDDGTMINYAPFWRLVPPGSWQKEVKATWDILCKGDHDWSHLAMRLWPERVVPKCWADRSLAIAHGLEEVFWSKKTNEKWEPNLCPLRPVQALIDERSFPAVHSALHSLLEAPNVSATKRSRRSKPS